MSEPVTVWWTWFPATRPKNPVSMQVVSIGRKIVEEIPSSYCQDTKIKSYITVIPYIDSFLFLNVPFQRYKTSILSSQFPTMLR